MITDESTFFADLFPGFLSSLFAKNRECHVVFQTTRKVGAYAAGPLRSKPGLQVEIHDGLSRREMRELAGGPFRTEIDLAVRHHSQALAEAMPETIPSAALLVKYLAFIGLQKELAKLDNICERNPALRILIVICDCDLEAKTLWLDPYVNSRKVTHVVVTKAHGAEKLMGRICDDLIAAWPTTHGGA